MARYGSSLRGKIQKNASMHYRLAPGATRTPPHGDSGADDVKGRPAPFRVPVTFKRKQGLVMLDQVRTVDKVRLIKKEGVVAEQTLLATLRTLQEVFAE